MRPSNPEPRPRRAPRVRTTPRKQPRQQRSQATVQAILDATARVLCKTGYDRASTNRIAVAAGVSVGSLYQYFPSKEALVAALVERHLAQMVELIGATVAGLGEAPLDVAVRAMIRVMFEAHGVDPALHKVLIEQVPRVGRLEQVVGVERRVEALIGSMLEARRAEVRPTRRAAAAFVLCHVVEAVSHAAVLAELAPARVTEVEAELAELILRYLPRGRSAER